MINSITHNSCVFTSSSTNVAQQKKSFSSTISDLKINHQKQIHGNILTIPAIADFKQTESQINDYLELALSLDPNQKGKTEESLNQIIPDLVEKILREGFESATEIDSNMIDQHKKNLEELDLSDPISPFLFKESFVKKSPKLEIAVVGANILSRGSSVISLGMLLNKIQDIILSKKNLLETTTDDNQKITLQNEIDILTKWYDLHSKSFSRLVTKSLTDSFFSLPKASAAIISIAKVGSSYIGMLIGWIGMGISMVSYALDWKSKQNKVDTHELWTKLFEGNGKTVDEILENQKTVHQARMISNLPHLNTLLQSIQDKIKSTEIGTPEEKDLLLDALLIDLKDKGIVFSEKPSSLFALQETLSNPSNKDFLNDMMIKKKEMLSISLKNALKAMNQKKNEIDKGFLNKEKDQSSGFFILYAYITGWTITLESLLASSIFTSPLLIGFLSTTLSVLSFGTLAGLVVSLSLGAVYLYMKQPNLFKTYVQGVQARLMFWKIPLSIQRFRKNSRLLEEIKVYGEITHIGNQILKASPTARKELENERKAKEEEWKVLSNQVAELNASICSLEERIKPLQEQVEKAAWKDLQQPKDNLRLIAKRLLENEDSETKNLLLKMGIDLDNFEGLDKELAIQKMSAMIRAFVSLDVEDKIKIAQQQNH